MKHLLLAIAALLCIQTATAQEWKINVGTESKALKYTGSNVVQTTGFIGAIGNTTYLMRYTDERKSDGKPYLASYNRDLVEQRQTMLPDGKNQTLYGGFANAESIDLLMTDKEGKTYKAYKLCYDPTTLAEKSSPKELASFTSSANIYTFVSSSQSNEWTAIIFAEVADESVEWRINMYDTELEELWNMELSLGYVNDWLVTDSADVITAGYHKSKDSKDTYLNFNVIDGERDHSFKIEEELDDLQTMEVVRYADGKIYCTGLIAGEKQDQTGRWNSGFYSLVFDTRTGKMSHYEKKDFIKENIADLCNVAHRIKMKVLSTDRVSFCNARSDNDGTTVLFERTYNLFVDGIFNYSDYVGMLLYRIDNDGRIAWYNTIPRDVKAPAGIQNGVRSRLITTGVEGKYTVFYIDSPKNMEPKPGKPAAEIAINRSSNGLMGLSVDKQGNITRQILQIPSKSACIGAPHLLSQGEFMLLLSQPHQSNIAILKYE
ncbi:MAG: hypothetical protein IIY87_07515 [Bacteroidales bacterium]|nr:hypothetical protein [Bacteroidales bacterium]